MEIPEVIPPRTLVVLRGGGAGLSPAHRREIGREFRAGYYSRNDGLDCIWLVNERGEYEQTVDREYLVKHFPIVKWGRPRGLYGEGERRLPALRGRGTWKKSATKTAARKTG
ncbi:MAG TPA: hypothetical protein VH253_04315 [Phycisphaerae bacterium]|nr:hypothetical protein [Phycisphaerae bacterium]